MSATAYREVPCYASQFFAYEALKRLLTPPGKTDNELGAPRLILAGGLAGITGWVFSYPQDFIKSQLQSEPYDQKTLFKKHPLLLDGGFLTCLKQTIRTEGWKALWRGFGTCAARAFPANAAGFCAYEWSLAMLRDKRKT
jgi:solute carrier family 25 carnitine/acylcarnitine transporter 20/29